MKAFVTGGTGFLGGHVVRLLVERGAKVRALARPTSNLANFEGLDLEVVTGDVADVARWESELKDCDTLFHVAADYRLWVPDPGVMFRTNVEGTRQVLEAAIRHKAKRIVYTSTVGALGYPRRADQVSNEDSEPTEGELIGPYKQSKRQAELIARKVAAEGYPIVIVYPSTPVGPCDRAPTPTGRIILDFLRGKMPGYVNTGLNLIDVRDCAAGHLLAVEKAPPGQRYILGNRNMTLKEILRVVAEHAGRKVPRFQVPYLVAYVYAAIDTFIADRITGRPPVAPLDGVRLAAHHMYFDASKAVRELGLPQNSVENALREAADWFIENGYVS